MGWQEGAGGVAAHSESGLGRGRGDAETLPVEEGRSSRSVRVPLRNRRRGAVLTNRRPHGSQRGGVGGTSHSHTQNFRGKWKAALFPAFLKKMHCCNQAAFLVGWFTQAHMDACFGSLALSSFLTPLGRDSLKAEVK